MTLHGRTLIFLGAFLAATCWTGRDWPGVLVFGLACVMAGVFCETRRTS